MSRQPFKILVATGAFILLQNSLLEPTPSLLRKNMALMVAIFD